MCSRVTAFIISSTLAVILCAVTSALAQIEVTATDFLNLRGQSQILETDTTGSVTVNVGSAGGNQVWDFRNLSLQTESVDQAFLAPQNTPYGAQFPQSNFVQSTTDPADSGFVFYIYWQVTTDSLKVVGGVVAAPDTAFFGFGTEEVAPLPVRLGSTWVSAEADTFGAPEFGFTITSSMTTNTVDAWGTVRLPVGDFECLRVRGDDVTITNLVIGGVVFFSDTTETISYAWISKNDVLVAEVSSQDGETNPNFTDAASFSRLASRTTGVAQRSSDDQMPPSFRLAQNYPNPFNPETRIAFEMAREGHVELGIYNLMGEKVKTLFSGSVHSGTHHATWDGKDEAGRNLPSGVYFYELKSGSFRQARRMVLVR